MARLGDGTDKPRFLDGANSNPTAGQVKWSFKKTFWISGMYIGALIGGWSYFSWGHFAIFLLCSALVLCFGHSLGLHRRLIHGSFACSKSLEYVLVYFGTLVGLAGPFSMIYTHDLRDWAQRKPNCHDYFAHRQSFFVDAWWQLCCDVELENPPTLIIESEIKKDKFYQFLENTWMIQQLPIACLFYLMGGWGWVFWGVCARVTVCVTGHWLIGYFAHRGGDRDWHMNGAGVQGYNLGFAALITFGESWHNNHHAFPGSANLGSKPGQVDPGWWVLKAFEWAGLAWDLQTPATIPKPDNLIAYTE